MSASKKRKPARRKPVKSKGTAGKKVVGQTPHKGKAAKTSKSSNKVSKAKSVKAFKTFTAKQIKEKLNEQRQQRKQLLAKRRALAVRDKFKPRKKDRGKLVFVGTNGKADAQNKGRKGYLLYVTRTGKKWLVKQAGKKQETKARKLTDIEPPANKILRKKAQEFQRSKRVLVSKHKRVAIKGSGEVKIKGAWDFNESVVKTIAKSVHKALSNQASKRSFLIESMVLVELPDKSTQVFNFTIPIDRPDHLAIEEGGIQNFIRLKFYAFMAKELAFAGFVSSGSANHIRRLSENEESEPGEYTKAGETWEGNGLDIVKIRSIEWKIEQAK